MPYNPMDAPRRIQPGGSGSGGNATRTTPISRTGLGNPMAPDTVVPPGLEGSGPPPDLTPVRSPDRGGAGTLGDAVNNLHRPVPGSDPKPIAGMPDHGEEDA